MKLHIKELLANKLFTAIIEENEVIIIQSSTGGGTGSGMAPVVENILSSIYKDKKFILVGTMPRLKESVDSQQNTVDYMKELRKTRPTYMLYDNSKFEHLPPAEMLKAVNREIVEDLRVIRGDYQKLTPYDSLDEKDTLNILRTPDRLVVVRVTGLKEKDVDDKSIEDRLIDAIRTSAHAELDRDQIIKRMGVIVNLNEKLQASFDPTLPKFKEIYGEPVQTFMHIFVNNEGEDNSVILILSGLSVPDDRFEKIIQRIDDATLALTRTKQSSILDDASTELVSDLRKNTSDDNGDDTFDIGDAFSKYM